MVKTKSKILVIIALVAIMLISILQIKSLATTTDMVIVMDNNNQYLIYVDGLLKQSFEFAFSNTENAENLNYIVSEEDAEGNSIAYIDEALKQEYFTTENTYIWVKTEDKMVINGEKINLDNAKTVQSLDSIKNITKNITVQSSAEQEKIKINGEDGTDYYYKFYVASSSEEYNRLLALVNEISNYSEKTNIITKLEGYSELQELYNSLVPSVDDENWIKAENMEITKPYGAKENEQYILWLKDSNGNIDVQFLTAYEKEVTLVEKVEKTEEVTVSLPVTYDNITGLVIALIVIIIAIVAIIVFKIINKKRRD